MKIAILCSAVLALMQLSLGLGVSAMRRKHRMSVGAPSDPDHPLSRVRTAFSNCAEWHPLLIALMVLLSWDAPKWTLWLPPLVVGARCLMVVGLATYPNSRPNTFRLLGAAGTYLLTFLLSVMIILAYWPAAAAQHP